VRRFNGDDSSPVWTLVNGVAGGTERWNSAGAADGFVPDLRAFNSKLYAFWQEPLSGDDRIYAGVWNGDTSFAGSARNLTLDSGVPLGDNSRDTRDPSTAVHDGKLYMLLLEDVSGVGTNFNPDAYVYNGNDSSADWTRIGDNLNAVTAAQSVQPRLASCGGILYAA